MPRRVFQQRRPPARPNLPGARRTAKTSPPWGLRAWCTPGRGENPNRNALAIDGVKRVIGVLSEGNGARS